MALPEDSQRAELLLEIMACQTKRKEGQMCRSIRWCAAKLNFCSMGKTEFCTVRPQIRAMLLTFLSLVGYMLGRENGIIVIWSTQ